ncbi:GNAT family N-acetyltransferase [Holophaga foetida]|uniref:GNAT family N-acetyltransferase n=1 Tax=Holophaga foetida TaxID=35839 RepID=UPI0002474CEE|nr:N-acetyltransferase [Holophaga foetida]
MDYTLRPAHPDDLEIVLPWAGTADLLQRWGGPSLAFPGNPKSIWVEIEASPDNTRSLVDANREVVGFGQALRRGRNIHLARIIVSPDHRGHGLGLILCRRLIQQAIHGHRPDEITLNVHPDNAVAMALYRTLGFRPTAGLPESEAIRMFLRPVPPFTTDAANATEYPLPSS